MDTVLPEFGYSLASLCCGHICQYGKQMMLREWEDQVIVPSMTKAMESEDRAGA